MCGIFGYYGSRNATPILVEGLRRLEYRGYDSSGIAVKNGDIQIYKKSGKVERLSKIISSKVEGGIGIAHTRWATHGEANDINAHPHLSFDGKVAIVHNGIIENFREVRRNLTAKGIELDSETDSEVLAQLIALELAKGNKPIVAVRRILKRVHGTWGLCAVFSEHDQIVVARNGSPLVIGKGRNETFISSDPHALKEHTQEVYFLEDGDLAQIDDNGFKITRMGGQLSATEATVLEEEWGEVELGEYPHFMIKEIHEQAEALRQCIAGRTRHNQGTVKLGGLKLTPAEMRAIPHVRLIGCGTSLHACQIGQIAIEELARLPAVAHVASEFRYNDSVINTKAIHLAVSQSGETADTLSAVKEIQLKGGNVWGIINVVASSIARQCGMGVYIHSGPEQAVASTKAFSNMATALILFAIQMGRTRSFSAERGRELIDNLHTMPGQIEKYLANPGPIEAAVDAVINAKSVLFLGRGVSAPVAREGALKLMEIAYIPCLAYPAGEMKHGPIALLEKGSPVVVIAPNDKLKYKTLSNIQECRARGAKIILIHEEGDKELADEADISISVPKSASLLSPLLTVIPTQLIAYQAALKLGHDVDRPRNLAKSVTVE